jgi:hypothetical protein
VILTGPDLRCGPSLRLGVRFYLPSRLAPFGSLLLRVDGFGAQTQRVLRDRNGQRFIHVPMRGRHCGDHLVTVSRPGVVPAVQVWTVRGHLAIYRKAAK